VELSKQNVTGWLNEVDPMVGTCERASEPSGTLKGGECVNQQKPDVLILLVCGPESLVSTFQDDELVYLKV
jgi:hypothetical protein